MIRIHRAVEALWEPAEASVGPVTPPTPGKLSAQSHDVRVFKGALGLKSFNAPKGFVLRARSATDTHQVSKVSDVATTSFLPQTVHFLLDLAKERASGLLVAALPELEVSFVISEGRVRDLVFEGRSSLELIFADLLDPAVLERTAEMAAQANITVGEAVLRASLLPDEDAVEAVLAFVSTSFAGALGATGR